MDDSALFPGGHCEPRERYLAALSWNVVSGRCAET